MTVNATDLRKPWYPCGDEVEIGVRGLAVSCTGGLAARLRSITRELGVLLTFDEVISLRLGHGGAQGVYGVEPDLTTMERSSVEGSPSPLSGGRRI